MGQVGTRMLSAICLAPLVLIAVWLGGAVFFLLVLVAALISAFEWDRLTGGDGTGRAVAGLAAAAAVTVSCAWWAGVGAAAVVGAVAVPASAWNARRGGRSAAMAAAGMLYIAVPAVSLLWLRARPDIGLALVLWLLAVVWTSDIAAYGSGRLIGGPPLAPRLSPGKTWAGLVGGVVLAAAVAAALGPALFGDQRGLTIGWRLSGLSWFALAGALTALVGQLGDLAESGLKRRRGVKDSGALIPGHGGLMDRVDSLATSAPFLALLVVITEGAIPQWP